MNITVDGAWSFLLDTRSPVSCIPCCEHVDSPGDESYTEYIKGTIKPIAANSNNGMDVGEINLPEGLEIVPSTSGYQYYCGHLNSREALMNGVCHAKL